MKDLISIGIDPGSSKGAIAIIKVNLEILKLTYAPYYIVRSKTKQNTKKLNRKTMKYERDYRAFKWSDFKLTGNLLRPFVKSSTDIIYTIERVGARRGEGEHSSFIFGNSMGVFQGMYAMLNPIEYYEPLPSVWKSALGVTADKTTSVELAKEIFGDSLNKLGIPDSKDDLHEALLLAFYGLKNYVEQIEKGAKG